MKADWKKIKIEYLKGTSRKEICEKYKVNYNTLDSRIKKEKWTQRKTKISRQVDEKIEETVTSSLLSTQEKFIAEQTQIGHDLIDQGKRFYSVLESPSELKALVESMEKSIRIVRQSLGISDKIEIGTDNKEAKIISVNVFN